VTSSTQRLLKTIILIGVVYASVFGVLLGMQFALGTEHPLVQVKGNSMVPTYYDGEILILKGVANKSDIKVQDVIVFHNPYSWDVLIVHRVVKILSDDPLVFQTRGDNVGHDDPWRVQEEHIVGIVMQKIPFIGDIVSIIQTPFGMGILFSLIIIIIIVDFFWDKK
jgi:signal peptidase